MLSRFCRYRSALGKQSIGSSLPLLLSSAALALGCPQMLSDEFTVADAVANAGAGSTQVAEGGSGATAGGSGAALSAGGAAGSSQPPTAGRANAPPVADAADATAPYEPDDSGVSPSQQPPDAGALDAGTLDAAVPLLDATPPPDTDGGAPACSPSSEVCDGLDNDCNNVVDDPGTCPTNCVGVQILEATYMYCGGNGSAHSSAATVCNSRSMQLAVVESAQEDDAIVQTVGPLYEQHATLSETQAIIWLRANDQANEGTWVWRDAGDVFWVGEGDGVAVNGAYTNWASDKPNNNALLTGEDCGGMAVGTGPDGLGQWNDFPCGDAHTFLCELSE